MPLTLTLTEGALPPGREHAVFSQLCEVMLRWHGLTGNSFMTSAVIGSIQLLPQAQTYAGLHAGPVAFIEWKVPPVAFASREIQIGYIAEATELVHAASDGALARDRIWINVVHAVDGAWGIAGRAMTTAQLGESIAAAAQP